MSTLIMPLVTLSIHQSLLATSGFILRLGMDLLPCEWSCMGAKKVRYFVPCFTHKLEWK